MIQNGELFWAPQRCPRCKKLHLRENYFCEHCLYNFLQDETELK